MPGYESCIELLEAYIDGSRRMDVDVLRGCFHPRAVMNGYLAGQRLLGWPEPFFQDIAGMKADGVSHDAFDALVEQLDVTGDVASAVVRMDRLGDRMNFRDYFHLLRDEGGWLITSKTFTSLK